MFFDPGTKTETKADPLSRDALIAWLVLQPADKTYCYADTGHCLLGQYLEHVFGDEILTGSFTFDVWRGNNCRVNSAKIPEGWDGIAKGHPRTFGAALDRARALSREG